MQTKKKNPFGCLPLPSSPPPLLHHLLFHLLPPPPPFSTLLPLPPLDFNALLLIWPPLSTYVSFVMDIKQAGQVWERRPGRFVLCYFHPVWYKKEAECVSIVREQPLRSLMRRSERRTHGCGQWRKRRLPLRQGHSAFHLGRWRHFRSPQRDTSPAAGPRGTLRESLENGTLHAASLKVLMQPDSLWAGLILRLCVLSLQWWAFNNLRLLYVSSLF